MSVRLIPETFMKYVRTALMNSSLFYLIGLPVSNLRNRDREYDFLHRTDLLFELCLRISHLLFAAVVW
jgi:hypothetical protein